MSTDRRLAERGQSLTIIAMFMAIVAMVLVFGVNVMMYMTNANTAVDGSLRSAGLAALAQVDTDKGYSRWYVDPEAGTVTARDFADASISQYDGLFIGDLSATLRGLNGTSGDTLVGLDIEIINPAVDQTQVSERYLNCPMTASDLGGAVCVPELLLPTGEYPESVESVLLPGQFYNVSTVILRGRLLVNQMSGDMTTSRTVVVRAGTDDVQ